MKKQYEVFYNCSNCNEWKSQVIEAKTVNEAKRVITGHLNGVRIEAVNYLGLKFNDCIY